MADLEDDEAELGGELIELTAPNVEEAIKLVLDHWVKIFNDYEDTIYWNDPKINFETGLGRSLLIQLDSNADGEGLFFNICPIGDFHDEIEEKEAIFMEKGLEGRKESQREITRSFMDKILNRPKKYYPYQVGVFTKIFKFGHVEVAEITTDVMRVVKAMAEVFSEYFGDGNIKLVSVDASRVDAVFPNSALPLLKNIDVTIVKS